MTNRKYTSAAFCKNVSCFSPTLVTLTRSSAVFSHNGRYWSYSREVIRDRRKTFTKRILVCTKHRYLVHDQASRMQLIFFKTRKFWYAFPVLKNLGRQQSMILKLILFIFWILSLNLQSKLILWFRTQIIDDEKWIRQFTNFQNT